MPTTDREGPSLATEFRACVGLLTRLPAGTNDPLSPDAMARASRWFPAVGALVGLLSAGVLGLCLLLSLPGMAAAWVAIGFSILATGALHEDGLADMADGFGGGMDRDAKLAIMRDSRVGTYGMLALILTIGLRGILLAALVDDGFRPAVTALIVAAAVSRLTPVLLMHRLPAARRAGLAVAAGTPDAASVRVAAALALASLLLLSAWPAMLATVIAVLAGAGAVGALAQRQIGGQTGDVLGAGQQVTEVFVLIGLVAAGP